MSKATLEQWLQRLESLHPSEIELGLERVSAVAGRLELLRPEQPVVTVAGTNGKGSTVAVLEALLVADGKKTGSLTSPHFLRFNERIRLAGVEAADAEIISAFEAVEAAREHISLTYFEYSTLAALWLFREWQVDVMILEVGLGGRLDAVNIIDPTIAIITSIALDHQDWLGDTRAAIALEKAGIVRCGIAVLIADSDPPEELLQRMAEVGAYPVLRLGHEFDADESAPVVQARLSRPGGGSTELPLPDLAGVLPQNAGAALQAALLLGVEVDSRQLQEALAGMRLTGRRQSLQVAGVDYILDVAHNPAAINKLLEKIAVTPCKGKTIALFSVMKDKDIKAMVNAAAEVFDAWFLADQPGNARAARAADIAELLRAAGQTMISVSKNIKQALRRAQGLMSSGDRLVIFGSFHTVAGVLPALEKDRGKNVVGAPT